MSAVGTFRTWRDVRLESVNRLKADMDDCWSIEALRDVNSFAASIAMKSGNDAVSLLSKHKGENHEPYDNRIGNSLQSHKHARAGASPRMAGVRITRGSFIWFVCLAFRGFSNSLPHFYAHLSRRSSPSLPPFGSNSP